MIPAGFIVRPHPTQQLHWSTFPPVHLLYFKSQAAELDISQLLAPEHEEPTSQLLAPEHEESTSPQAQRVLREDLQKLPWTAQEDKALISLRNKGTPYKEIVCDLPTRKEGSCRQRYHLLTQFTKEEKARYASVYERYVESCST
jgi:Myb-like DNA-binding domain